MMSALMMTAMLPEKNHLLGHQTQFANVKHRIGFNFPCGDLRVHTFIGGIVSVAQSLIS
jgi:hypothetical protein